MNSCGLLKGRERITTTMNPTSSNILELLDTVLPIHNRNRVQVDYLYNYYKGEQPILNRIKKIRPDINNKIVENHAYEIVEFKTGYTFGQPIQYIQRGKDDNPNTSSAVSQLNEIMHMNDKSTKDREIGEWMFVCGVGYRMILPSRKGNLSPVRFDSMDPRNTFVVYDAGFGREPVLGVTYVESELNGEPVVDYGVYSKDRYWLIRENGIQERRIIRDLPLILGDIPIIEYVANPSRMGVFEPVIDLLDTINNVTSNRMDGIEQFIQSFIKFVNCDIDEKDFKNLSDLGAIKISSTDNKKADVEIITSELDQTQTQTLIDYLYQTVLTITGVPDRQASAGGNTGQALTIGQGWATAESRASATELMFKRSETRFLNIVLNILKENDNYKELHELSIQEIDTKFTRNKTDNLLVKTQGLQNMLEAGVHPREAFAHANLFSDPEQIYNDSKEYLEKWKFSKGSETNQKPNPINELE